ncbi:MAG: hypothetical protein ABFD63_14130 [Smithella sp.]
MGAIYSLFANGARIILFKDDFQVTDLWDSKGQTLQKLFSDESKKSYQAAQR